MLKWSESALLAWQSSLGWWKQQGGEPELWGRSARSSAPPQPSVGEEDDDEEAEEEDAEDEGSGQSGRWQWPLSEWEVASPPLTPTPLSSSPTSGAAKVQRGCLQGVHLCTSEHFLLHTCIKKHRGWDRWKHIGFKHNKLQIINNNFWLLMFNNKTLYSITKFY